MRYDWIQLGTTALALAQLVGLERLTLARRHSVS
jgi:hypothetical protein